MESSNNENSNTGEVGPPATTSIINDREEDVNLAVGGQSMTAAA